MTKKKIEADLQEALRNKEKLRLEVLRAVKTALTNQSIDEGLGPQGELEEDGVIAVIKRLSKQRRDSIEQFRNGGRDDLAQKEELELVILEHYLPDMMDRDSIKDIAISKKEELGIQDKSKMGVLIGAVIKEINNKKGQADGKDVKEVVESLF